MQYNEWGILIEMSKIYIFTFAWIPIVVFLIPMIQHERSVDWNLGEAKKQRDVLQTALSSHLYQLTSTQRGNIAAETDV